MTMRCSVDAKGDISRVAAFVLQLIPCKYRIFRAATVRLKAVYKRNIRQRKNWLTLYC